MPDLGDMSDEEIVRDVVSQGGDAALLGQAELTRRLIVALNTSSAKITSLTWWLIGFTAALVLVGVATLAATLWS
jgi:hypothetical protein